MQNAEAKRLAAAKKDKRAQIASIQAQVQQLEAKLKSLDAELKTKKREYDDAEQTRNTKMDELKVSRFVSGARLLWYRSRGASWWVAEAAGGAWSWTSLQAPSCGCAAYFAHTRHGRMPRFSTTWQCSRIWRPWLL